MRIRESNNSAEQWRRGRRCSRIWGRDSPASLHVDHGETAVLLQPMEVHSGSEIHLQPVEDPMPEKGFPKSL